MKPSRADGQSGTNNNFFHQDNAIATTVSSREKRKQNVGFKVFKGNLTTFIIADTTEEKNYCWPTLSLIRNNFSV